MELGKDVDAAIEQFWQEVEKFIIIQRIKVRMLKYIAGITSMPSRGWSNSWRNLKNGYETSIVRLTTSTTTALCGVRRDA